MLKLPLTFGKFFSSSLFSSLLFNGIYLIKTNNFFFLKKKKEEEEDTPRTNKKRKRKEPINEIETPSSSTKKRKVRDSLDDPINYWESENEEEERYDSDYEPDSEQEEEDMEYNPKGTITPVSELKYAYGRFNVFFNLFNFILLFFCYSDGYQGSKSPAVEKETEGRPKRKKIRPVQHWDGEKAVYVTEKSQSGKLFYFIIF